MKSKFALPLPRHASVAAAIALSAASLAVASPARADEPAAAGASAATGGTDHAKMVGRLAVAWMGVNGVPIGSGTYQATGRYENNVFIDDSAAKCGLPAQNGVLNATCRPTLSNSASTAPTVAAPTVGVRYWLNEKMGVDVGLGLGFYSGSNVSYPYGNDPASQDIQYNLNKASVMALALHAGVPLVLGEPSKHYNFQVIPEANVGFASATIKDQYAPPSNPRPGQSPQAAQPVREDFKVGGFRLDVGARAGAEIQFGFLGIPELALQGSVGLYFTYRSVSATVGGKTASDSDTGVSTSVQQAPWALFTNNISALYYF